ncbi:MAG: ABC transporter substrate-binding protein [Pseudomonadota bacterium]
MISHIGLRGLVPLAFVLAVASARAAPITVENCGKPLAFDRTPERMVVHDINMSEMAFALGLQDRMVGITGVSGWYKTTAEFDAAKGALPELAPKYPTLENLVAVQPDLFFAGWYYGMKPGGDVTPETLMAHGIKTLVLTESCVHLNKNRPAASFDLLFNDIARLGQVFGKEKEAAGLIASWKSQIAEIKAALGDARGKRVFLYDSGQDKPFTAGRFAMPTAMIETLGAVNITADMETSWGTTSWESVAAADPEFMILLDYQSGGGAQALLEFLKNHPVMKHVSAVKHEAYVPLRYEELTPGPANISALAKIAAAMKR